MSVVAGVAGSVELMPLLVAGLAVAAVVVPDGLATLSVPLTSLRPPQSPLERQA